MVKYGLINLMKALIGGVMNRIEDSSKSLPLNELKGIKSVKFAYPTVSEVKVLEILRSFSFQRHYDLSQLIGAVLQLEGIEIDESDLKATKAFMSIALERARTAETPEEIISDMQTALQDVKIKIFDSIKAKIDAAELKYKGLEDGEKKKKSANRLFRLVGSLIANDPSPKLSIDQKVAAQKHLKENFDPTDALGSYKAAMGKDLKEPPEKKSAEPKTEGVRGQATFTLTSESRRQQTTSAKEATRQLPTDEAVKAEKKANEKIAHTRETERREREKKLEEQETTQAEAIKAKVKKENIGQDNQKRGRK